MANARPGSRSVRTAALFAIVLLLLLAAAIGGTATFRARRDRLPAQAQMRLDQYLAYAFPDGQAAVTAIDRAAHPSQVTHGSLGPTFGGSTHFETDLGVSDTSVGSRAPLPFPPTDVWCVLLTSVRPPAGQIVLVALHADLYSADWIVHKGPDDASSVQGHHLLSTLGCTLTPEPGDFNALNRAKQNGHRSYASIRVPAIFN